jgi:D-alanine-D-alanine ligase-like ATP-grasp enzyme
MIWREKRILLIVLGVLLAANTIFFFTYRVQYENRLRELDQRLEQTKGQLDEARRTRVAAEQQLAGYRKVEKDLRQIYEVEWSTENQRLTRFIGEVMRLGTVSQLTPRSYSFTGAVSKGTKVAGANAIEVGVAFPVEGTYQQIRRLINLLELSDQFVIIDQVSLSSGTGDKLNMTIRVKTLFRDTAAPAARQSNQEL